MIYLETLTKFLVKMRDRKYSHMSKTISRSKMLSQLPKTLLNKTLGFSKSKLIILNLLKRLRFRVLLPGTNKIIFLIRKNLLPKDLLILNNNNTHLPRIQRIILIRLLIYLITLGPNNSSSNSSNSQTILIIFLT